MLHLPVPPYRPVGFPDHGAESAVLGFAARCSTWGNPKTALAPSGAPFQDNEPKRGKPQDRTVHCSLFTVPCSLFTVHCSLFPVPCSLFTQLCSCNKCDRLLLINVAKKFPSRFLDIVTAHFLSPVTCDDARNQYAESCCQSDTRHRH